MNELAQAHTQVLIAAAISLKLAPRLFVRQALLEAAENLNVGKLALGKPGVGDHAQALAQHAKELRAVGNDDDGLLDRRARDVGGAVDELRRVELAGAGDAEEGGGGLGVCGWSEEGKVGKVFFGAIYSVLAQVLPLSLGGQKRTRGHRRSGP